MEALYHLKYNVPATEMVQIVEDVGDLKSFNSQFSYHK